MRLETLKTFLYLADTNCDFKGHTALGVARTNMWNHINEIEKSTGLKLIIRQRGKSFFTKEGLAFVPVARETYRTYEDGLNRILHKGSPEVEGNIIISTTSAVATGWLMPSIKDFHISYPNLKVNIIASDYLDKSTEAGADILFRPIGNNPDLIKKWYIQYNHGLFASESYLKEKGIPKKPEDLLNHCIMAYGTHEFSHFEDINWHLKGKWGLPKLVPTLTINSTSSLFSATSQGIGICSHPVESNAFYKDILSEKSLIRVLPQIQGPSLNVYFCVKQNMSSSTEKNTDIFQNFFQKYLKNKGIENDYD